MKSWRNGDIKTYSTEQLYPLQKGKKPYECPTIYKIFYKVEEGLIDVVEFTNPDHYLKFLDLLEKEGYSGSRGCHYLRSGKGDHTNLFEELYR